MIFFPTSFSPSSWDAAFVLLRPYSFPGGPLGFIFAPYAKYMVVDKVYGDVNNAFGWAQSTMCMVENLVLMYAMFVLYPREKHVKNRATIAQPSDVVALMACSVQLGKSLLYWMNDAYGNFEHIRHNNLFDLVFFFIIPNAIWLFGPLFVIRFLVGKMFNAIKKANKE